MRGAFTGAAVGHADCRARTVPVNISATESPGTGVCVVTAEGAVTNAFHLDADSTATLGILLTGIAELLGFGHTEEDEVCTKTSDAFAVPTFRALLKTLIGTNETLRPLYAESPQTLLIVVARTAEGSWFDLAGVKAIRAPGLIVGEG